MHRQKPYTNTYFQHSLEKKKCVDIFLLRHTRMHPLAYAILTYWTHHLTHPWKLNSYATLQSVVRGQGEGTNWPDVSSNHAFKDHMSPIPPDNQTVHNMLRKYTKLHFHPLNFENFFIYLFCNSHIFIYWLIQYQNTLYVFES